MTKKLLAVTSVLSFYAWGTIAWFTGSLKLADELPMLALTANLINVAGLVAPFFRVTLGRFRRGQLIVGLSGLSAVGLILMTNEEFLAYGFVGIGACRLLLIPNITAIAESHFGPNRAIMLISGVSFAMSAALKPLVAYMVAKDLWCYGLLCGVLLAAIFAVTTCFSIHQENTNSAQSVVIKVACNTKRLGQAVVILAGIRLFHGVREIVVYRIAEDLLGSVTLAGKLESLSDAAVFVGIIFLPLLSNNLVALVMIVQSLSCIITVIAINLRSELLLHLAQVSGGVTYGLLEKFAEVSILWELGSYPNAELAYQWVGAITRIGLMVTRVLASSSLPLETIFGITASFSILTIIVCRSPLALWAGNRLFQIASVRSR
jgi:hypothetical protein